MRSGAHFTTSGALALVERVLRGGHDIFFELLGQAADNAVDAAQLLDALLSEFPRGSERAERIAVCERRGDDLVHRLIERLNRELATPIEHEDLLALVSALDDIVDLVDDVAAYLSRYQIEAAMPRASALAHVLLAATRELAQAVHKSARLEDISAHVVEVHRLENDGDQLSRAAIASLFDGNVEPLLVIRWKDIFERIEDAIDSTERAALVLEGALIKNS